TYCEVCSRRSSGGARGLRFFLPWGLLQSGPSRSGSSSSTRSSGRLKGSELSSISGSTSEASSTVRLFPSTDFCRWLFEEPGAALSVSAPFPTQAAVLSASRIDAVMSSSCDVPCLSAPEGVWVRVVVGCPVPSPIFEASSSSMRNSELSSSGAGRITVAYVRMQSSCS
ncbi:unnamed protein product, partial [Ixodes persulcatus]